MMWILAGIYCGLLWLIFDKLRLIRFSLPIAILAGSIGPSLILALLFCAQYYHPMSQSLSVFQKVIPIIPQTTQRSRVVNLLVKPNTPIKKGDVLFEVDRVPFQITVDRLKASVNEAEQSVQVALASVNVAKSTILRAASDLNYATRDRDRVEPLVRTNSISQEDYDKAINRYEQASAANDQAQTALKQSESSVDGARARLAQTQSNLSDAEYDFEQATTRAPADGFVTNVQLLPGMLVGGLGASPVLSFVAERGEEEQGVVVATIPQKNYLLVKPGQYAEVVLNCYPGQVLKGKVETTIDVTGAGQLSATGSLPVQLGQREVPFAIRIRLDNSSLRLPAGINGSAAVYTEHIPISGIPVMLIMRMQSWIQYVW